MLIKVRVYSDAKKEKIVKASEDDFQLWMKAGSEQNEMNRRVCEMVASSFGVTERAVEIRSGHEESEKMLFVKLL